MKAYEIFKESSDDLGISIFQYLRDEQKEVYQASLASLTQNRRLRPVFIQRKPVAQQIVWLLKNVQLKGSNEIAEHVLQLWLMKAHQAVLVEFLDGNGIEHDGEGAADDLPDDLDAKKLKATVEKLLADHDSEVIRAYLHTFNLQSLDGFDALNTLIAETPELQFGEPTAAPAAEEETETEEEVPAAEEEKSEDEPAPKKKAASKKKAAKKKAPAKYKDE
jgi:CDP-glycerol glycerophosphotransferase (TagB/SpsB family)